MAEPGPLALFLMAPSLPHPSTLGAAPLPYTPYHFGPGLLLKAGLARRLSFLAFCTTQVAVDLESWYYLTGGEYPVHRLLHTFLGATLIGLGVAGLVLITDRAVRWVIGRRAAHLSIGRPVVVFASEVNWRGVLVGGLLGGLTHVLLDSVLHADVQPLRPFSTVNPFLDLVSWDLVENASILAGVAGAVWLGLRRDVWSVPE